MPTWVLEILKVLASNPEALAEIIKLINRLVDLCEKNPELVVAITKKLNAQ